MNKEMPLVFLVCIVFKACGKKEDVVNIAATNPNTVVVFILFNKHKIKR